MSEKGLKRIVVVGASAAIAEHIVRYWLKTSDLDLLLLGRDREKLDRIKSDFKVRSPGSKIQAETIDFKDPDAILKFIDQVSADKPVDIAIIAHGFLPDKEKAREDLKLFRDALEINGISPILFADRFLFHMEKVGKGTLAIIGSVAGDRGRAGNYIYGAAKGMLYRYAEGVQHQLSSSDIKIVFIKPGPVDTPMTEHLKSKNYPMADLEKTAASIAKGIEKGKPVLYVPFIWKPIMLLIRHLPRFIFNKVRV